MKRPPIGIYEKALPEIPDWSQRLSMVAKAGFDFVEIAVDDAEERLARLNWSQQQIIQVREAALNAGVSIYNLILSAHRRFPLGSADGGTRQKGLDLLKRGIDFSEQLGIRIIQLAGYYVFYETRDERAYHRFLEGLYQGVEWAGQAGVTLALENMDGEDITSIHQAMHFVEQVNSPWLQVYPDLGNLAGNHRDVTQELPLAQGHLVGIHLKDALPGVFRRVPFGDGIVPFTQAFQTLADMEYKGNFLIEMWNDGAPDALQRVTKALSWIQQRMVEGGLIVEKA